MAKRKGLGRGLNALLPNAANVATAATTDSGQQGGTQQDVAASASGILKDLPVEWLQRGKYQPRQDMHPDSLEELAESIKAQGVMQPVVVRAIGDNKYEIIAGERRWRASQIAGLDKIPAVIRDVPDEAAIAMALIENIQREDLNPIEEAVALKRLQEEFELTQQEVADAVGKSRSAIANILRLLNLTDDVRTLVEHGDLEMGHARCLLTLDSAEQKQTARQIVAQGLSVRQAESLVRKIQSEQKNTKQEEPNKDIQKLEENLAEHLGVPVIFQHQAKGKGRLVLKYNNLDELDGILRHLRFEQH